MTTTTPSSKKINVDCVIQSAVNALVGYQMNVSLVIKTSLTTCSCMAHNVC